MQDHRQELFVEVWIVLVRAGKYHVNLQRRLLELIREARWLARMGIDIPEAARLVLPQEPKFRDYFDRLTHLLLVRSHPSHTTLTHVMRGFSQLGLVARSY